MQAQEAWQTRTFLSTVSFCNMTDVQVRGMQGHLQQQGQAVKRLEDKVEEVCNSTALRCDELHAGLSNFSRLEAEVIYDVYIQAFPQ